MLAAGAQRDLRDILGGAGQHPAQCSVDGRAGGKRSEAGMNTPLSCSTLFS